MKIIIHHENPDPLVQQLERARPGHEIRSCDSYQGLPRMLADFHPYAVFTIRFAGTPGFPAQALLGDAGPKWIHVGGSGTDHLGRWNPARTIVTNSAGVAASAMAEYAIGAFLHFSLDVPGLKSDQKNHQWNARSIGRLEGKTLLIIGLGNTGQAVARLAAAFGMHVIGTRATPRETPHVSEVHDNSALSHLLPKADFIVVSLPLYDVTKGLLDCDAFAKMKNGSVLVDVSRGGIVSGEALLQALDSGRLRGAALDVFETEPLPKDSPFWSIPNLLISPHCSSVFGGWEASSMELFCANLDLLEKGEPMKNLVTAQ